MKIILRNLFLIIIISFFINVKSVFAGTAFYNAGEDRIEYDGTITIEEIYQQIGNPLYLEKEGTNKYIIHKNIFGGKSSELDLSNSEVVFDGFLQILTYGKVTMNDAIIYSINGQGLICCYRGESGIDPNKFGLFANNLRWWETRLEANGNSWSFDYKNIITNSSMEKFTFPSEANVLTPSWPNYIAPVRINYGTNSEITNVSFKDITWSLPLDTWQAYSGCICFAGVRGIYIDNVTFENINLSLRDNANVGAIGLWSNNGVTIKNVVAKDLNLSHGFAQHAQVSENNTYSNIILEGKNIPESGLLSTAHTRYGHRGLSHGRNIERTDNITIKNFTRGFSSITACGFELTNFLISNIKTGVDMGMVWMLNASEISYGDAVEPRLLKHGTIQNTDVGYYLKGTCTTANDGTPIPESWGIIKVYSEDVQIIANDKAITTTWPTRHEFYGLNDSYNGANHDVYIIREDFYLNLINCTFNPAKTYISAANSYIKDYRLITVRVLNQFDEPVSDAIISISPQNGGEVIRADGVTQTTFRTDDLGCTSVAGDDKTNSAAILNWEKTSTEILTDYTYIINANKDGMSVDSDVIIPGEIFDYRIHGNIITLRINLNLSYGKLLGSVYDKLGNPIANAVISFSNWNVFSGNDGSYEISGIPEGTYNLVISAAGYKSLNKTITIISGQITTENFQLEPLSLSDIHIFPNPYIGGKFTQERIIFGDLPKGSTLRIYTIAGKLIKGIKYKNTADGGSKEWDISGIFSGIYIYTIISPEGKKTGKISIIK